MDTEKTNLIMTYDRRALRLIMFVCTILISCPYCHNVQAQDSFPPSADGNGGGWQDTIATVNVYGRRPLATRQTLAGKELQALSATSIADALKYFAGVQIKDYGGLGGMKTVNVRSLGAQHVGIYIDGIRVTNAQNGTVDLGKFSLSTMETVELYNGNKLDDCQSASEYASGRLSTSAHAVRRRTLSRHS